MNRKIDIVIHKDVDIMKIDDWARRAAIDLNAYLEAANHAGQRGVESTRTLVADYRSLIEDGVVDPVTELDGE